MIYWHHDDLTVPLKRLALRNCGARIPNGFHMLAQSLRPPRSPPWLALPSCKSAWGRRWMGARCNRSEINT